MKPPAPWSSFHIVFSLCGLCMAVILAFVLSGIPFVKTGIFSKSSGSNPSKAIINNCISSRLPGIWVLWICGIILALSEIYKQLFLYQIVNQNHYDWWYFPFQLCSTPMYLCLAFPLAPSGKFRKAAAAYLESFGFLGGIMALAEPSGLMHPYWVLTIHGFLWHILLVFIALFCAGLDWGGQYAQDYTEALPMFFVFCLIATFINILTRGKSDMFYISPYYPITQAVFHQISLVCGTLPGIIIYLLSVCVGAFFCHRLANIIFRPKTD